MDRANNLLIQALQCFVHEEKIDLSGLKDEKDWEPVFQLADIHSVGGILCYMVMNNPGGIPPSVLERARTICLRTMAEYTLRGQRMQLLSAKLSREGISHLLFKGFVLKDIYPVPELRTYGDVDFLIRIRDREKCHERMLQWGYTVKTDWEPVFSYWKGTASTEIYTDVMEVDVSDQADYKAYFSTIWEHAEEKSKDVYVLTPSFHLLYLLTHIAKHISSSGAGIRMYMDIAVYLRHYRETIDWDAFREELEKLRFQSFANVVFTLVERCFCVESPIPLSPLPEGVFDDFLEYTMEAGVFGHYNRDAGLVSLKQESRNDDSVNKTSTLLHRLFPSAEQIKSRYTYLQDKPWLLPAAWIHRFFRTQHSWRAHANEMKSILNTEDEAVLKLKRIYKEIGL